MPDIIMFEKPKQLYALGLVDKYDRIAACFVDPSTTHPEPEIVAVPLTQLGLLHIGNRYKTLRDSVTPESHSLAGKRIGTGQRNLRSLTCTHGSGSISTSRDISSKIPYVSGGANNL